MNPVRLFSFLVLALGASITIADPVIVDSDNLEQALKPAEAEQPRTRSLGQTRAIKVRVKSKVDLNIPFELNSSQLAPDAERQLMALSDALKRDSLAAFEFEIAGHTDASGSANYNRNLSEARAESVMRFLIDSGVDPSRLQSVGHGEDQLLDPERPNSPQNRRVEIRNLGTQQDQ